MYHERRPVSPKTPGDGRVDVTKVLAARLERLGGPFAVELRGQRTPAVLGSAPCSCRGAERPHVHYFIRSEALRALSPGGTIELTLDEAAAVLQVSLVP